MRYDGLSVPNRIPSSRAQEGISRVRKESSPFYMDCCYSVFIEIYEEVNVYDISSRLPGATSIQQKSICPKGQKGNA